MPSTPDATPRLGRDTRRTVEQFDRIAEQVPPAPRLFRGPVPRRGVGLERFRHRRRRAQLIGCCVGEAMAASGETTVQTPDPLRPESEPTGLDVTFSALWCYRIARQETAKYDRSILWGDGAIVSDALKAVQAHGLARYDTWPSTEANYRNYRDDRPPPGVAEAPKYKPIGEVRRLVDPDQVLEYLAAGYSVVVGTNWPEAALRTRPAADGRHWFDWSGRSVGGHAYELLGYDLDADWVCAGNSWDNASWGSQPGGYAYTKLSVYLRELSAAMLANGRSEAIVYTEVEGDWHPKARPIDWPDVLKRI